MEQRRLFGKWDTILDTAESGPFWLREREVATLMVEALHYRDTRVYDLDAFCIMPNRVHVVFTPLRKEDGSYHAVVRDEAERQRIITYVLNNPVKANLVEHWQDWPWTYSKHPL
ncbi:MAG: hypothetical protein HYR94_26990 [Chloroflexi bacterium]|nr:hypothetical protein [Chloroflexota bacterium]